MTTAAAPEKAGPAKAKAAGSNQSARTPAAPAKAAAAAVTTTGAKAAASGKGGTSGKTVSAEKIALKVPPSKADVSKPVANKKAPSVSGAQKVVAGDTQPASSAGSQSAKTAAKTENSNKLASKIVVPASKAAVPPAPEQPVKAKGGVPRAPVTEKVEMTVTAAKVPLQPVAAREPEKAQAPLAAPAKPKAAPPKNGFRLNEFIVYPAHGVGQIIGVETQEVAGFSLELYVVSFIKDKMILKVPTSKVSTVGMRKLAETNIVEKALTTLSGRARVKRTMWSRRAQEYEAKINSGDLITIAEVVRDLYRSDTQPEQSYSERQLYEAALDRMAREISAVRRLIDAEALKLIESFLQKGPKRGAKADSDVEGEVDAEETDVERAA
jgi:CarD family transcriptional regulator